MKTLLNRVIDGQNQSYELFLELKPSSLPEHFDIRFFSKFSGANDPDSEQTKWKTTLPRDAIINLANYITEELDNG